CGNSGRGWHPHARGSGKCKQGTKSGKHPQGCGILGPAQQSGVPQFHIEIAVKVNQATAADQGMRDVQAWSEIGARKDRGIFHNGSAINLALAFQGSTGADQSSRADPGMGANITGAEHADRAWDANTLGNPYARLNLFSYRLNVTVPGKSVLHELAVIGGTGEAIQKPRVLVIAGARD